MAGEGSKTLVLAQDGDLVLLVGDSDNQIGIKVNSALLRAASKVFNAMLGPQFAEGRYFDNSNLKDVPLPEDDPGAMAALCSIIYYRNDLLEELPEARKIFFMAVLADKYDCTILLRQTSQYWFTFSPPLVYDWAYMIAAAYILNNEQGFQKFAEKLVLEYDLPYGSLHQQTVAICQSTPWKLWYLLESRRSLIRYKLDSAITTTYNGLYCEECRLTLERTRLAIKTTTSLMEKLASVREWADAKSLPCVTKRKPYQWSCAHMRENMRDELYQQLSMHTVCIVCARFSGFGKSDFCKADHATV